MQITTEDPKTLSDLLAARLRTGWCLRIGITTGPDTHEHDVIFEEIRGNRIKVTFGDREDGRDPDERPVSFDLADIDSIHIY